jgi:hypothetical protein
MATLHLLGTGAAVSNPGRTTTNCGSAGSHYHLEVDAAQV